LPPSLSKPANLYGIYASSRPFLLSLPRKALESSGEEFVSVSQYLLIKLRSWVILQPREEALENAGEDLKL